MFIMNEKSWVWGRAVGGAVFVLDALAIDVWSRGECEVVGMTKWPSKWPFVYESCVKDLSASTGTDDHRSSWPRLVES